MYVATCSCRNKRQHADLIPFASHGHIVIGVTLAPEYDISELAEMLDLYALFTKALHFGGEGKHNHGIPNDLVYAVQDYDTRVKEQYVI